MDPSMPKTAKARSGLTSRVSKMGGIMFLNKFKYGSQRSLIADNGWRSQGMLGNQLSNTLTIKTPLYISSHLAKPAATTVKGVFKYPLGRSSRAAENNGPTELTWLLCARIAANSLRLGRNEIPPTDRAYF
ncbi:hypothetical protein P3X46_011940 [Hevea brasiliensis]|uniref:Uncharacterized protein n=1 Tax=Hevea brasiliensis TaxID=3981 RepID=A0ABQ9M8Q2_HEVBR|nr:hypothetical protein P3X46_011940 [Hevea brasiliensis]